MSTVLDERPDLRTTDGDEDHFTHIVYPKSKLADAMVFGHEIDALCGKRWVPSRDPQVYEVCPACIQVCKDHGWEVPNA